MRVSRSRTRRYPPDDGSARAAPTSVRSLDELTPELTVDAGAAEQTQPLWPPRPIAFESATSTRASRASFGT